MANDDEWLQELRESRIAVQALGTAVYDALGKRSRGVLQSHERRAIEQIQRDMRALTELLTIAAENFERRFPLFYIRSLVGEGLPVERLKLRVQAEPCDLPGLNGKLLDRPPVVAEFFYTRLKHEPQEVLAVAYLSAGSRLIGWAEMFRGAVDRIWVEPRQVFQLGLLVGAGSAVVCHFHPSGNPNPSPVDHAFTERLKEAGQMIGIPLNDHVIVARGGDFVSMKRRGPW